MIEVYWAVVLGIMGAFAAGLFTAKLLIKYKAKVLKDKGNYLVLTMPLLGQIQTRNREILRSICS